MRLIGVGDNTVDTYLHLGKMFPGGNAVNAAVMASRSGHTASYLGWLGDDRAGHLILDALSEEGVDTSRCRMIDGPNAFCEINLVAGERVFGTSSAGVRTQIHLTADDYEFIARHDIAHTGIYSALDDQLPRLADSAPRLSYDYSDESGKQTLTNTLPYVTIAAVSAPDLSGEEVEAFLKWAYALGPEIVLLTQGENGAFAYNGDRVVYQPVIETDVVDTLGAGDAFLTRFLVSYYSGTGLEESLNLAAAAAAKNCKIYGAFGHGIPIA